MIQPSNFNNKHNNNEPVKVHRDMQNYIKPLYCSCCNTTVYHTSLEDHFNTEYHKTAQFLRKMVPEPIDDIKQKVVEFKMIVNYIKKTFNIDSSLYSETLVDQIKKIDDKTKNNLKRKSEVYSRELDHRAEVYERTKGIEKIVRSIKTCNRRLTKLQIIKYNNYLLKFPNNESLLSVQHLVPKRDV